MLRRPYLPLVALALVLAAPSAAEAQLGGMIKKAAKAAATKAVEKKVGGEEQQAESGSESDERPRTTLDSLYKIAHPSSADVQSLSGDLLSKFFAGYATEHTYISKINACTQRVYESAQWKAWQDAPQATEAEGKAIDAKMRAHMLKTCDVDVDELDVPRYRGMIAGAQAAGMPPRQYAMVRERVLAFAALAAKHNTDNYRGYKFSGGEKQALEARRADALQLLNDERGK